MTFYTVPELKALLKLSRSQVYALIESGKLKCHRFTTGATGGIRVSQEQLDAFLGATAGEEPPAKTAVSPPERPTGFTVLDGGRLREAWRQRGGPAGPRASRNARSSASSCGPSVR